MALGRRGGGSQEADIAFVKKDEMAHLHFPIFFWTTQPPLVLWMELRVMSLAYTYTVLKLAFTVRFALHLLSHSNSYSYSLV